MWRFSLVITLTIFVVFPPGLCAGLVLQDADQNNAQSSKPLEIHPPGEETVLLHKGSEICLHPAHELSTQTSKQGDRVAFSLDDDLFAEGTVVALRGAELSATIAELNKPGRGDKDGVLLLSFDPLRFANGQQITLSPRHRPNASINSKDSGREDYLMAGPLLPLVPLLIPFSKGMDVVLHQNECINYEIAQDLRVRKAEMVSKLPQENNWKERLREMASHVREQEQNISSAAASVPPENGNIILGFDLTNQHERNLAECKHCYSPVTCADCFGARSEYWRIIYLQEDGIYSTIAHPEKDLKYLGYNRIFQGNFSRIMAVMGSHFVAASFTSSSCKLILFGTALGQAYWMDEISCDEIVRGYAEQVRAGVSAVQMLEGRWVGEVESQPAKAKNIFFTNKAGTHISLPDSSVDDRFDPAWIDSSHILYAGNKIAGSKKHKSQHGN